MKTNSIILAGIFTLFSIISFAQNKTVKEESIKVWGNCGMCKSTIEKAAKSAGASSAIWNEDTKILKVKYAASKTSGTKIQQKVADAGYDTKDLTANDEAYNNLHDCCKYERKAANGITGHEAKNCCQDKNCKHDKTLCATKCDKESKDCCSGK